MRSMFDPGFESYLKIKKMFVGPFLQNSIENIFVI